MEGWSGDSSSHRVCTRGPAGHGREEEEAAGGGGARQVHAQPQAACGASGIPTRDSPGSVPWEEHPGPRWARISEPNTAHLNTEPQLFPYKMGLIRELQRTKPQMSLQNKEGEGARGRRRRVCGLN